MRTLEKLADAIATHDATAVASVCEDDGLIHAVSGKEIARYTIRCENRTFSDLFLGRQNAVLNFFDAAGQKVFFVRVDIARFHVAEYYLPIEIYRPFLIAQNPNYNVNG